MANLNEKSRELSYFIKESLHYIVIFQYSIKRRAILGTSVFYIHCIPGNYIIIFILVKVTLLSAPVSSEQLFCETTAFRKRLISPIPFGLSKSGKMEVAYIVLAVERNMNRNVSVKAGFMNYFSKLFQNFLSRKLLKIAWFSFALSLATFFIHNTAKSDCKR